MVDTVEEGVDEHLKSFSSWEIIEAGKESDSAGATCCLPHGH